MTQDTPLAPSAQMMAEAMAVIRPHGNLLLVSICPQQSRPIEARAFLMPDEVDEATGWALHMNGQARNVYFTVNMTMQMAKKAAKADMVQAVAYWADCDPQVFKFKGYERAREHLLLNLLPKLQRTASYIIDSGNGLSPFFSLATPQTIEGDWEDYERVNEAIGAIFDGPGTFNCDRVMRLPGSLNYPNAAKIKKGYPTEPSLARMMFVGQKTYTPDAMKALVSSLQLTNKFETYLQSHPTVAERYAGSSAGLNDSSGSAMDFSMVSMLKLGGFELPEIMALLNNWKHGSASEQRNELRYWQRCFDRTTPEPQQLPAVDFSALLSTHKVEIKQDKGTTPVPDRLLRPPGVLGEVVDWVNATARKPQPLFAVQTAIAFGATVLGRRFVTDQRNWPSLYLLNIGQSGSGKEHAKKAVESLLEACELDILIGPASYTSNSAVLSALHDKPSHITVIDEFGKELEQAAVKNNARAQGMLRMLIEVWGRCDGTIRPQGYSTFGLSDAEASRIKDRSTRNPALTLMAMTTPESFFETIGSAAARDGFLNRFIIVESEVPPQVSRMVPHVPVPDSIIEWAKRVHQVSATLVDSSSSASASLVPSPILVKISREAHELFANFDAHCVARMQELSNTGLMEMMVRTNEMAMKLALIVSMGCDREGTMQTVTGEHAAWAINYIRFHAERTIERLHTSVHDSDFEASKQQVMGKLIKAGAKGMTERELAINCRRFKSMNKRQQIELLSSLDFIGQAKRVKIPPPTGRGPGREAWIAIDDAEDADTVPPPDGESE